MPHGSIPTQARHDVDPIPAGEIPDMRQTTPNDLITLAAQTLHRYGKPNAGAELRDEHACDRSGRCRGCPHAVTPAPLYPCRLRRIGEAAAQLDQQAARRDRERTPTP